MSIHLREPVIHQGIDRLSIPCSTGFIRALLVVVFVTGAGISLTRADEGPRREPQTHWSFQPIRSPVPPVTRNRSWVKSPIDAFILRKLEDEGLEPAPAASRLVWLRRASFDLLGLPPSPEEIERFLGDERPDADERLIDRLLASPQYGERWGRHWLDVVRYADTGGFEADLLYPSAWRFRDYVIRSLDADKPFDHFIQEQIAGDELWPDDPDAVLGSTLYSIGPAQSESAMVAGQLEYEWLTDAADTTGEAFLGLSFGCARCHDHKYDPIRQAEYYAMQAIFAASDRPYPEKIRLNRIKALNGLLAEVPVPRALLDDPRCTVKTEDQSGFRLFHRAEPMVIHRLNRGEWNKPQEAVEPGFPAILMPARGQTQFDSVAPTKRRAALGRWLTSPENPMVARVLVNRVWGWHFARAIVRTPNDFGKQGEEPTHPELLDYLSRELIDHGWSLKHLHRLIMLSNTYRMSSVAEGPSARKDPENLWLGHFPRRRLEGEEIRDAMLACSGRLNAKRFGEPVVPPLSREELTGLFDAKDKWPVTEDPAEPARRSVYLLVRRTFVYPMFSAFDPPELMTSCARRLQTIVPAQALTLLNSPLAREQSAAFAKRILRESSGDREKAIDRGWLLAYGRPVTKAESDRALKFLEDRAMILADSGKGSISPRKDSYRSANSHPSPSQEEAAMADLCRVLFNTNAFIFVD